METLKSIIYYIIVVVLVIYIAVMTLSPERMMDFFGYRPFIVLSNSMEPVINVNDMIVSKQVSEDEIEVGDIITISVYVPSLDEEVFVTHYVGSIEEVDGVRTYKTRALSLPEDHFDVWVDENDDPITLTFDDIEGEYVFKIPYIGYIPKTLSNKTMLGLVIFTVSSFYLLIRYLKKDHKEE